MVQARSGYAHRTGICWALRADRGAALISQVRRDTSAFDAAKVTVRARLAY
ncbi:hypothetical protein [Asticcacaulis sp. EMRT-3]|uniref:hypothetical protein n=1 Tax=Asticcacaulis sp. EMRT-3 TaxID=3040349 RepID=UPI0024AFAC31|nr:hypothetical protein [Asticcacaulis sp. EMRT-3]MDI7775075.1 hypothetical protein [Asticcacaulis sp. EMRT-3]